MTDDGAPDLGDLVADPARPRRRRTWPERLAIVTTFGTAALCLLTAFALVSVYLVVRQKNVVELDVPAAVAAQRRAARVETTDGPARPAATTTVPAGTTASSTSSTSTSSTSTSSTPTSSTRTAAPTDTPDPDPPRSATATGTGSRVTTSSAPATTIAPSSSAVTTSLPADRRATSTVSGVTPTPRPAATTATTTPTTTPAATSTTTAPPAVPDTTFPPADPAAKNFLITGADNGACIDPDSPYAAAFGDRADLGERSDTIMVVRVDPRHNRVAVLSFPRDLWVEIAGSGSMQRINSAYRRNEPQRLVDTIYDQFGVSVDHYIQFDFCAFKTLVDAVGGIDVPFEHPARDTRTGLLIDTAGCVNLDGERALAYVRSRYFEYDPGDGEWRRDRSSDLGRISRQQDFIRRTLATVSSKGLMNPDVVRGMLRAADRYIVTDRQLTPRKILEFAGVMRNVDPDSIMTYQIAATPRRVSGNEVLIPELDGALMRDVLALFRGELSLGDAPPEATLPATLPPATDPVRPDGTAATSVLPDSVVTATAGSTTPDGSAPDGTPANTAPVQEVIGIVPPVDLRC